MRSRSARSVRASISALRSSNSCLAAGSSSMRDAMLAAEATPWLQPRSHRTTAAPDRAMTLRIKAGRALDAQEAVPDLFGDGRPSNAE